MNEKRDKHKLEELGAHVKKLREKLGLSQDQVAANCELNKDKISKIENGRKDFFFTSFLELAKGLGVHPKRLLDKDFDFLHDE
jgi:transcriptional regulator with XRE-family HTH domain